MRRDWSNICELSWFGQVGYRYLLLPWITYATDRGIERESWKTEFCGGGGGGGDFVGENWLYLVWVWPCYVWYRSGINLNFTFSDYRESRRDLCKPICGLENLGNLFKLFGGRAESRDPWPKLVSCEWFFYRRKWVAWRFHPIQSGWIHTTEKSVWPQSYAEALWVSFEFPSPVWQF